MRQWICHVLLIEQDAPSYRGSTDVSLTAMRSDISTSLAVLNRRWALVRHGDYSKIYLDGVRILENSETEGLSSLLKPTTEQGYHAT
jgi:hypothetical protein